MVRVGSEEMDVVRRDLDHEVDVKQGWEEHRRKLEKSKWCKQCRD